MTAGKIFSSCFLLLIVLYISNISNKVSSAGLPIAALLTDLVFPLSMKPYIINILKKNYLLSNINYPWRHE